MRAVLAAVRVAAVIAKACTLYEGVRRAGVAIYVRNVVRCGSRVKKGSWNQPTPPRHPVCQCVDGRSGAADVALHAEHDGRSGRELTLRKSLHTSGLPAAAAMAAAATLLTVGVDEGDGPAPRQPPQSRCEPRQRAAPGAGKDVRRSVPIQTRFLFGRSDRGVTRPRLRAKFLLP